MARASARRHAQAIFEIALEQNQLDLWRGDLRVVAEALMDPDIHAFLESPKIRFDDKKKILEERLKSLSPLALNAAYLLVAKRRLGIVAELVSEYERLVDEHRGVAHARVTTAIPLDEGDTADLTRRLADTVSKEIVLATQTDPSIIGGLKVRIGDKLIDGSTRSRLEALRKSLVGT
ncbi:MAG: ATP synthase F1 subunit delta [Chloroflexota bacterium]|nr:ATP synthase F1 subunit delta [Chloroflexota bacterium]